MDQSFIYSPTDALVSCLTNQYIKIYIKITQLLYQLLHIYKIYTLKH